MSFSSDVKNEISKFCASSNCNIAEITAIINMCGHIIVCCDIIFIKVQSENILVIKRYSNLLKKIFNIVGEVKKSGHIYIVLTKNINSKIILKKANIDISNSINPINLKRVCCKKAYIRGAFLSSGSVSNPEKSYHLEFVNNNYRNIIDLQKLINHFDIESKIVERKGHFVIYLKEGEKIVDLLNVIGAHISLMKLENLRIIKDMRNNVNRMVNCETANLNKTVCASVKQLEDIQYIQNTIGLNSLPKVLEDTANSRIMFPDASLKELGEKLSPPIGKSGVNHRLKKISNIAENLKDKNREAHYV